MLLRTKVRMTVHYLYRWRVNIPGTDEAVSLEEVWTGMKVLLSLTTGEEVLVSSRTTWGPDGGRRSHTSEGLKNNLVLPDLPWGSGILGTITGVGVADSGLYPFLGLVHHTGRLG